MSCTLATIGTRLRSFATTDAAEDALHFLSEVWIELAVDEEVERRVDSHEQIGDIDCITNVTGRERARFEGDNLRLLSCKVSLTQNIACAHNVPTVEFAQEELEKCK